MDQAPIEMKTPAFCRRGICRPSGTALRENQARLSFQRISVPRGGPHSLQWESVKTEIQPGNVPQSGFESSIGTNIWLLAGFTATEWASVPVGKFSIPSFVPASMMPKTGDAAVAAGLVKKSRAPRCLHTRTDSAAAFADEGYSE